MIAISTQALPATQKDGANYANCSQYAHSKMFPFPPGHPKWSMSTSSIAPVEAYLRSSAHTNTSVSCPQKPMVSTVLHSVINSTAWSYGNPSHTMATAVTKCTSLCVVSISTSCSAILKQKIVQGPENIG